jgi:hypothetical protein
MKIIRSLQPSEFKLIDVLRGHNLCGAKDDFAVLPNDKRSKTAGREALTGAPIYLALSKRLRGIIRQVAKICDVPPNIL